MILSPYNEPLEPIGGKGRSASEGLRGGVEGVEGVEGRPLNYQILKNASPTRDPVFTSKSTNEIDKKL